MKIDGRCHCGHIAYAAEIDPEQVQLCHCTDCQTLTGTAFRAVAMSREGSFRLLSGALKLYVKTAESGRQRVQSFCPECGTPIYSTSPGAGPKVHALRLGSIVQRDRLVPKLQIWRRSARPWLAVLGTIPAAEMGVPL
jgi:hypothetical protein